MTILTFPRVPLVAFVALPFGLLASLDAPCAPRPAMAAPAAVAVRPPVPARALIGVIGTNDIGVIGTNATHADIGVVGNARVPRPNPDGVPRMAAPVTPSETVEPRASSAAHDKPSGVAPAGSR